MRYLIKVIIMMIPFTQQSHPLRTNTKCQLELTVMMMAMMMNTIIILQSVTNMKPMLED